MGELPRLIRLFVLATALAALHLCWASGAWAAPASTAKWIAILPIEPVPDEEAVRWAISALEQSFGVEVVRLPAETAPKAIRSPHREKCFDADRALPWLATRVPAGATTLVAITARDIAYWKSKEAPAWRIFGLGNLGRPPAIVSSSRLWIGPNKTRVSPRLAHERFAKVVVHEVGHNLGVNHCPTYGCIMEDAVGRGSTVDREKGFCSICRATFEKVLPAMKGRRPPWEK